MGILDVNGLSHSFLDKVLYNDASFTVNKNDHLGIVGKNGAGKSTLIKIITGQQLPDSGKITWQKNTKIGYLDQYAEIDPEITVNDFLKTAFAELFEKYEKLNKLYEDYAESGNDKLLNRAAKYQEDLEAADFYNIQTEVDKISSGLGIDIFGADTPISTLSGGQRSKLILAKLLLQQPDILLLDEPTNYLDVSHINWLTDYLQSFPSAFLLISHDFDFLGKVTNAILDIEFGKVTRYTGNLKSAMEQKEQKSEMYMKEYEKQQREIKHAEKFIAKFKAGTRSTQAKSREKQLNKIQKMDAPRKRPTPHFDFDYSPISTANVLSVEDLAVGYEKPLFRPISFNIANGQKAVIKGFNGIGKTTLLKTVLGILTPIEGDVTLEANMKVGYYRQELNFPNKQETPLNYLSEMYPKVEPKTLRQYLSRVGLTAKEAMEPIEKLSGGEQSKIKIAELLLQKINVLVLDEPTNHLDEMTKNEFVRSLKAFPGSIILVTHEEGFYDNSWIDQEINIEKQL